jgi:predicted nucleic acid-binding protein
LSEDLQTGRTVDGVQVTSPFETSPGELEAE